MAQALYILDTGIDLQGETQARASNSVVLLNSTSIRWEFDIAKTDNTALRYVTNIVSGKSKSFENNESAAVFSPRITIQGYIEEDKLTDLTTLVNMTRTLGKKKIRGGIGVVQSLPEAIDQEIFVKISKLSFSEVVDDTLEMVAFTLMLEQQI